MTCPQSLGSVDLGHPTLSSSEEVLGANFATQSYVGVPKFWFDEVFCMRAGSLRKKKSPAPPGVGSAKPMVGCWLSGSNKTSTRAHLRARAVIRFPSPTVSSVRGTMQKRKNTRSFPGRCPWSSRDTNPCAITTVSLSRELNP